jgi:ABC-2 type transport system ATP-binding protein
VRAYEGEDAARHVREVLAETATHQQLAGKAPADD